MNTSFEETLRHMTAPVEARLKALFAAGDGPLHAAMAHGVLGGGKRLRPFLVIAATRMLGGPEASAIEVGAALECLHCYSLIHDDLPAMDDDALRRGRPTVHKAYGEATAILAGDALLTLAFEIVSGEACHDDPAIRASLALALARAAGADGMIAGQMLDMGAGEATPEAEDVMALQALKTGRLFGFALTAGAMISRADDAARDAVSAYARTFGLAFQIADDLLDREGDAASLGKATGKDAARGKATLVDLLGADGARARAHALIDDAIAAVSGFGEKAAPLVAAARFVIARNR